MGCFQSSADAPQQKYEAGPANQQPSQPQQPAPGEAYRGSPSLARPDGYNTPFLQRHAPNGQVWADYVAPAPPNLGPRGAVTGAWQECIYAGVAFELTNEGWDRMPEYADNGPVGYIIQYAEACGYGWACGTFEQEEERCKGILTSPPVSGSLAFLMHKARNGQTWEEYLRTVPAQVGPSGFVHGAWGECITAAVIFEHENPGWNNLGPYAADGPAGQVLQFLENCGQGGMVSALNATEEATHQAVQNGGRIPVFDITVYQPPVQVAPAPQVNQPPPPPSGRKKALLVGCNYPGSKAQLNGCVNDVGTWEKMLKSKCGFTDRDILKLTDKGHSDYQRFPVRANILGGVRWLVDGAIPGDMLFFQFSGHGGQRESKDCSEADGMDEVLLPTDYMEAGVIVDHELFDVLCVPLPSGCKLTVILDCCHSGSALDLPFVWNGSQWEVDQYPWHTAGDVQMFSGCDDSQCSMDVTRFGRAGGAMTQAMNDVLDKVGKKGTAGYPELLEMLLASLQKRGYEQTPRLSSSQAFDVSQKPWSVTDYIVPNLNPQLGQAQVPPPKQGRNNVGDFRW